MVNQEQFNYQELFQVLNLKDKQQQLKNLNDMIKRNINNTKLFPFATNLVFGDGNINADILFIGEAPGKNEDKLGKPFVGSSGKILTDLLDRISIKREDVYITNIVKYRPFNNQDPTPEEKIIFLPYLICQILIIQPKLIVTLGRHSFNSLLPNRLIKDYHGKILRIDLKELEINIFKKISLNTVFNLLPIYHPAATIYNRNLKDVLVKDFLRIPYLI